MSRTRVHRWLAIGGGLVLLVTAALWTAGPQANNARQGFVLDLGPVEQFEPGTVATFKFRAGGVQRLRDLPDGAVTHEGFHLVRLEDGDVRAFSWRGPESGHAVWWMPELIISGQPGYFIDTRDRSRWYLDGARAFGPADRNLDEFEARVDDRGHVLVDVSRVLRGGPPPPPPLRV